MRAWASVSLTLASLSGCPSTHDVDAGVDAVVADAADGGADVPSDVAMDVPQDVPARADAPDASTDSGPPVDATYTYVVSYLDVPEVFGDTAAGFDLDGMVSFGATARCDDSPDYTSTLTGPGVDNSYASIAGLLAMQLAEGSFHAAFGARFASGSDLILVAVDDVDSFTTDPMVRVTLHAVATETGAPPRLAADGRLAADQRFVSMTMLGATTGRIAGGSLLSGPGLSLPLRLGATEPLPIRDVRLGGRITGPGITAGELGGHQTLTDIVALATSLGLPVDEMTIRSFLPPDLLPADPSGSVCNAVSIGLTFEAVPAVLVAP